MALQLTSSAPVRWKMTPQIRIPFILGFLSLASTTLFLLLFYSSIQPVLPLFSSLSQEAAQLAPKQTVLIILMISLVVLLAEGFVAQFLSREVQTLRIFAWVVAVSAFAISLAVIRSIIVTL